jgi:tellurite resistance-related uncharacterized protein
MYKERLKFYADTPKEKNKYFCFGIVPLFKRDTPLHSFFEKGWNIRSAYWEKLEINEETGEIKVLENLRINVTAELEKFVFSRTKRNI